MTNAKPTPGPWKLNGVVITARVDFSERPICEMSSSAPSRGAPKMNDEQRAEYLANGRLIAASHELFEAAEYILPWLESYITEFLDPVVVAAVEKLSSALTKATGAA